MPTADSSSIATAERTKIAAGSAGLPDSMFAAVYKGDSMVEVERIAVPEIGRGEVLIRVETCGICHTDLKKIAYNLLAPPRIYGHETAGVVAAVQGRPVSVLGFTVRGGKIAQIDILGDPARLRQLDLAGLDD